MKIYVKLDCYLKNIHISSSSWEVSKRGKLLEGKKGSNDKIRIEIIGTESTQPTPHGASTDSDDYGEVKG